MKDVADGSLVPGFRGELVLDPIAQFYRQNTVIFLVCSIDIGFNSIS